MQFVQRYAEQVAADQVVGADGKGGHPQGVAFVDVPLGPGEVGYAELCAKGWRYYGLEDVWYEHCAVLIGGPIMMALIAVLSAATNRRRRNEAERIAEPQWRPLGSLGVVVTSERLLVWHAGAWSSVSYNSIEGVRLHEGVDQLDLYFACDPPYRLAGQGLEAVAVVLARHRAVHPSGS